MMKKAFFMLAMLTCILAGCSGGGNDEPINPTPKPEEVKAEITLDSSIVSNGLSFGVASGEQIVSFSANTNWTLSVASTTSGATWCKASATSGSKGNATVKFTIDENTSYDDRSVSVTIKAGTASKTFTITQKGADALLVTTNKYEVAQEGGKIEVEVKANINYELAISETAKDWITESKSRALTTHKHTFEIALNEESEKREGEITFKSGDKVETVKVYQAGGAIILLSQNEYTVNDAGETISVDIKSNVEYGVQMPDVDWIADEVSSRGMSSHTLKYVISPNEGYDARSAEIIFYDKNSDLKDTLKIVQTQKDAIVISQKTFDVKAEGETLEVKLSANVDFEITMPDIGWISPKESRALKEHTLYFEVSKNENEESRSAEIVFVNKDSGLEEKIIINQQSPLPKAEITINVTETGTLSKHIGEDRIRTLKSLKIVGNLNGDDFKVIQQMQSLIILDLSDANIVSGGEYLLRYNATNYNTTLSAENNVLKAGMIPQNVEYFFAPQTLKETHGYYSYGLGAWSPFQSSCARFEPYHHETMSKLKYVELPENLDSLGSYSFANTNLEKINILNVPLIGDFAFYGARKLQQIIIGEKQKVIGTGAFGHCTSLSKVIIQEGLEEIKDRAFHESEINEIHLPPTLKKIGFQSFWHTKIEKVYIADIEKWCEIEFSGTDYDYTWGCYANPFSQNSRLFVQDTLVTDLIISKATAINSYSFGKYAYLENLYIGDQVKLLGRSAFLECKNLRNVTIGDGISTISEYAFWNCNKIEKIILGKNIKKNHVYKSTGLELLTNTKN